MHWTAVAVQSQKSIWALSWRKGNIIVAKPSVALLEFRVNTAAG
jgi:hypothetical protein